MNSMRQKSMRQSRAHVRNLIQAEESDCISEVRIILERAAIRHFEDRHTESLGAIEEAIECATRLVALQAILKEI